MWQSNLIGWTNRHKPVELISFLNFIVAHMLKRRRLRVQVYLVCDGLCFRPFYTPPPSFYIESPSRLNEGTSVYMYTLNATEDTFVNFKLPPVATPSNHSVVWMKAPPCPSIPWLVPRIMLSSILHSPHQFLHRITSWIEWRCPRVQVWCIILLNILL